MKLKRIALVVTVLSASIGVTNAEQISNPLVSIPLSAKTTQLDRAQPLEVMPYMESKVTGETELSYAVMSRAKKTFDEQMLEHHDAESRLHAHIEEHNRKIRGVPQRDLIKNPYTQEEIEKQIVDAINFRESIKYPINDKEYYNHIDVDKVNDLSGFPKKIPSFAKQVDIHQKNKQMGFDLEQDASQLSSDKVLSNDENKALQKKYLGYYSYKEVKRPFNAEYTFYIFKFDYLYNMFTVAGMAVNPEQTRVIYFLHTVQ